MLLDEPVEPRRARGAHLAEALREDLEPFAREDLEPFAREDLEERIALLEGEIVRVQAALGRKADGRAAADALFGA